MEHKPITPDVGRVVHVFEATPNGPQGPFAGTIAKVHSLRCINVGFFNASGVAGALQSVPLVQPGDSLPATGWYCAWMQHQIDAAKMINELDKKMERFDREMKAPVPAAVDHKPEEVKV